MLLGLSGLLGFLGRLALLGLIRVIRDIRVLRVFRVIQVLRVFTAVLPAPLLLAFCSSFLAFSLLLCLIACFVGRRSASEGECNCYLDSGQ